MGGSVWAMKKGHFICKFFFTCKKEVKTEEVSILKTCFFSVTLDQDGQEAEGF